MIVSVLSILAVVVIFMWGITECLKPNANNRVLGVVLISVSLILLLPFSIEISVANMPSTAGNDGDWIGFWGSFLGSVIGVAGAAIFAYMNTNFQLKEQRKNDLINALEIEDIKNKSKLLSLNNEYVKDIIVLRKNIEGLGTNNVAHIAKIKKYIARDKMIKLNKKRTEYVVEVSVYVSCIGGEILHDFIETQDNITSEWGKFSNTNVKELNNSINKIISNDDTNFETVKETSELELKLNAVICNLKKIEDSIEDMNRKLTASIANKRKEVM
ncbi:hypothetical protein GKC32_09430 [Lactobacillus curvatus]|nr:hypothetical protein [Latilactobacillus curvatus]MSD84783.1 hypothetical protein [Latilactobacillus curvatus]MSE24665.1 hypothetical protein [Latilactobacillus curvatus]